MDTRERQVIAVHISDVERGMMVVRSSSLVDEVLVVEHRGEGGMCFVVRYVSGRVTYHGEEDLLNVLDRGVAFQAEA